jgi:hypothetical protein
MAQKADCESKSIGDLAAPRVSHSLGMVKQTEDSTGVRGSKKTEHECSGVQHGGQRNGPLLQPIHKTSVPLEMRLVLARFRKGR